MTGLHNEHYRNLEAARKTKMGFGARRHHGVDIAGQASVVCGWIELLVGGRSAHVFDSGNKAVQK